MRSAISFEISLGVNKSDQVFQIHQEEGEEDEICFHFSQLLLHNPILSLPINFIFNIAPWSGHRSVCGRKVVATWKPLA